jgi:hypothetical protein
LNRPFVVVVFGVAFFFFDAGSGAPSGSSSAFLFVPPFFESTGAFKAAFFGDGVALILSQLPA